MTPRAGTRGGARARAWLFLLSLAGASATTSAARAHDEMLSNSEVVVGGDVVVWRVEVGVLGLARAGKLPKPDPGIDPRLLAPARDAIAAYLARGLEVALDGRVVPPEVGAFEPRWESVPGAAEPVVQRVSIELRYRAPGAGPARRVRAHLGFFSDLTRQHRAVVTVKSGQNFRQFVRLGPAELEFPTDLAPATAWSLLVEFLPWGVEHILIGYDHIAFVIALLLVAVRFRELVRIVTSFTIAHSLTLLLAALDVLRVPTRITEALIAASIVYVAAENLWLKNTRHRWWLTFLFGLVHGLGFATVLRERLADLSGSVVVPVVSFNLGVEAGQIAVVGLAFPILVRLRRGVDDASRARRQSRIVLAGSIPILVLGAVWLVQRTIWP